MSWLVWHYRYSVCLFETCALRSLVVGRSARFSIPQRRPPEEWRVVNHEREDPKDFIERARRYSWLARMCADTRASEACRSLARELAQRALELGADPRLVAFD